MKQETISGIFLIIVLLVVSFAVGRYIFPVRTGKIFIGCNSVIRGEISNTHMEDMLLSFTSKEECEAVGQKRPQINIDYGGSENFIIE